MRPTSSLLLILLGALAACANGAGPNFGFRSSDTPPDPETVIGDYLQGRFAASQQQYDKASNAFSRAAVMDDDISLIASAFRYSLAAGEFPAALGYAEQLLVMPKDMGTEHHNQQMASFVDQDLPRLTLAAEHFRKKDYPTAKASLEAPLSTSLGKAIAQLLIGWAINAEGGADTAMDALKESPEASYSGFGPFHLALMYDLEGDADTAEVAYAEALRGQGADMTVLAFAGFVEREQTPEEALQLYSTLSEDRGYLRRIGRMGLARLGQPLDGETKEFLETADRTPLQPVASPQDGAAMVFLNFAWSAYEQAISRRDAAIEAGFGEIKLNLEVPLTLAQLAVAVDNDLDAAHYIIGAISSYYDKYQVSAEANARVKPESWLFNYAAIDRAEAYVALGKPDVAINLIEDYLVQDALAPDVYTELAQLLAEKGQIGEALSAAGEAIRIADLLTSDQNRNDNLWRYYFIRGAISTEADRWDLAEPDLRQALGLAPDEPVLLNYLGYSYIERGENIDEAFDMIERALEARPTSGAITDSLGWAHYQRGEYQKAVELLERAVQLEPGDDVITDHLGDAYWQVGRKVEARFEWRRVLQIEGLDDELRESVQRKLDGEAPKPGHLTVQGSSE